MPEPTLDWGIAVVLWLQGLGDWLIGPMNVLTFTGNVNFLLFVLPVIYWSVDRRLGVRLALALLISMTLNSLLKMLFHTPRPYWYDPRVRLLGNGEAFFGLPSGHAQNAVVMWGMLAARIGRWWAWAGAIVLMVLVGLSRVHIGVHFPTDVLAGWLIGTLILFLFLRYEDAVIAWFERFPLNTQIGLLLVSSLLLIIVGGMMAGAIDTNWAIPVIWEQNALAAGGPLLGGISVQDTVASAAVFFGMASGAVWLSARGNFDAGGSLKYRLLRYVVGVLSLGAVYLGLDVIFAMIAADESILGLFLRYIRYGLVGFWMIGLAPVIFLRLGWTKLEQKPGR